MSRKKIIVLVISLLLSGCVSSKVVTKNINVSPPGESTLSTGDALDALRYCELMINEVEIEMSLFLGWHPDNKKAMAMAAKDAIKKLDEMKKFINWLKLPKEVLGVKDFELSTLYGLKLIYTSVENKSSKTIDKEFKEMRDLCAYIYEKNAEPIFDRYLEKLSEDFNPTDEELKFAKTKEDKERYAQAIKLMDTRKWKEAYGMFMGLLPKYKGSAFGQCVMLKVTDCIKMEGSDVGSDMDAEKMLSEIVNSKAYNPILGEAFAKWRSVYQEMNHGMSNFSEIPNDEYNDKRLEIAKIIKSYIKQNPNDAWARAQLRTLLAWPNIGRGQEYGNENLLWVAKFYFPDISKEEEKKK